MKNKSFIVLSSPSGGGKTTVAKYLIGKYPQISFSISATTRSKRPGEIEGKDYYYLSKEEFLKKIERGELIEYEEIFGNYYGTLVSQLQRAKNDNRILLFDVDVKGALSIKKFYPEESLLIFLSPPSMEVLEERLRNRNTENEEQLAKRLSRAKSEIEQANKFDYLITNNILDETLEKSEIIVKKEIFD